LLATLLAAATTLTGGLARAQAPGEDAARAPVAAAEDLSPVLVVGQQPGPGLWRVSDGDHELWILGTLTPLPKALAWHSPQVDALLGKSQALIAPPQANVSVGMFRALTLVPAWLRARHNPDNQTLKDVLPADVYARWTVLKSRYLGHDDGVERMRPVVASYELYRKAIGRAELSADDMVWERVRTEARARKVPVKSVSLETTIDDPKGALRQWQALPPAEEVRCFAETLDRLERDVALMRSRANLWSVGDVDALRTMVDVDPEGACMALLHGMGSLDAQVQKLRHQLEDAWYAAATESMGANRSTVAVVPIERLFRADGMLARLRERGYTVTEP